MNTTAVGQSGFGDSTVKDALAGAFVDRHQWLDAREQKAPGASLAVIVAQHDQKVVAQQRVALTTSFGMGNQQPMARAVQVLDLDVRGLRQAQATAIDATQESASAQVALGADGQELFDLAHAVEPWHAGGAAGPLDAVQERFDVLLEHL